MLAQLKRIFAECFWYFICISAIVAIFVIIFLFCGQGWKLDLQDLLIVTLGGAAGFFSASIFNIALGRKSNDEIFTELEKVKSLLANPTEQKQEKLLVSQVAMGKEKFNFLTSKENVDYVIELAKNEQNYFSSKIAHNIGWYAPFIAVIGLIIAIIVEGLFGQVGLGLTLFLVLIIVGYSIYHLGENGKKLDAALEGFNSLIQHGTMLKFNWQHTNNKDKNDFFRKAEIIFNEYSLIKDKHISTDKEKGRADWFEKNHKKIVTIAVVLGLIGLLAVPVSIFFGFQEWVAHPHLIAYTFRANNGSQGNTTYAPIYQVSYSRLTNVIAVTNDGQLPAIMDLPEYEYVIYCNGQKVYSDMLGVKDKSSAPEGTVAGSVVKEGETKLYLVDVYTKDLGFQIVEGCRLKVNFTTHNENVSVIYDKEIKILQ